MVHVLATIQINPGCRAEFLTELHGILELVRAEEGCLEYGPAIEIESRIPVQAPPREDVVTIIEKWTSLEHLTQHLAAQHMVEYRVRVKSFVKWVDLRILEPA